jgi:AcrR family transcriptional regulator
MEDFDLKKKILSNATKLFAQNGFNKTSIQKVADASNTSQTNVLYHFKTKKKMFEECLYVAIAKNRAILDGYKKRSDKESLLFLLETNVKWAINSTKDCQLFLLLYYFSSNDPYFKAITKKISMNAEELLLSYIENLKPINGFTHKSACSLLQNYIHGVMFNITAKEDDSIEQNYNENINLLVSQIFK